MKRIITIAVTIISVGVIVLLLIKNKKTLDAKNVVVDRSGLPVAVSVQQVKLLPVSNELILPATLTANEEANISVATAGRITELNIELGSRVGKGQIVGCLDMKESELKLQSTELAVEKLRRDYERNQVLAAGNATNKNAVQDSKYELDSKVFEAAQLRKQIGNGNMVSPITGIVTEKKMIRGEFATTGSVVATVVDVNTLKAKVFVPEVSVFKLKLKQPVTITTDVFPGEKFNGFVSYISPKGDDNHNYQVELSIQNNKTSQLRAGVYGLVTFGVGHETTSLQIPKVALVEGLKNPYVYVVKDNKAIERKIALGQEVGENVEVLEGLHQGDPVVISGQINIVNESNVNVITNK